MLAQKKTFFMVEMILFVKQKQSPKLENQLMVNKAGKEKWDNLGDWTDIYTPLWINKVTNENLPWSTGNSSQICGDLNGKEI